MKKCNCSETITKNLHKELSDSVYQVVEKTCIKCGKKTKEKHAITM